MHLKKLPFLALIFFILSCSSKTQADNNNWCGQEIRSQFLSLKEIRTSSNWFKVYSVGDNVYAIAEPYNFQEIISYLILGTERALLFDTGMGMSSMSEVVQELTDLPITVLNSHTHYDHIGSNHEFDNVLVMNTDYTLARAQNGIDHDLVKHEVTPQALCLDRLPGLDTANYYTKPFKIGALIEDESTIDLGERILRVISVPGHTPDAIALLDEANGYLWTGDTFYEAPIWLFDPETDLDQYQQSIQKLAKLSPQLQKVFPAHNTPIAVPIRLAELVDAFGQIMDKTKRADEVENGEVYYEFEHFSFIIRRDRLREKGIVE